MNNCFHRDMFPGKGEGGDQMLQYKKYYNQPLKIISHILY